MATLNKIQVIGNIGKDAEVRDVKDTKDGIKLIIFCMAVTEKYNDQEHTDWFDCSYFVKGDKLAALLKKGTSVFVEGKMRCNKYTTKDNETRSSWGILVSNIQLLSKKDSGTMPEEVKHLADKFDAKPTGSGLQF